MAKLGLFNDAQQRWFRFDVDTEVLIRFLSREELTAIIKKAAKRAKLSGADSDQLANIMTGKAAVLGWRKITNQDHPGFLDGQGAPIPFTPENRDLLMRRCREFSNFVNETAIDSAGFLADADDVDEEEDLDEAKNE